MKKTAIIAAAFLCGGLSAPVLAEQEKRDCRMASLKDCIEYGKTELERTTTVITTTDSSEDSKRVIQTRQGGREVVRWKNPSTNA